VDLFLEKVLELLGSWSTEDVIELEVKLSHREGSLRYTRH
jgi:type VI secretion system protein ImpG